MTPDYAHARCCAITRAGKRCTGRWASARPILWQWDPTTGEGIAGPYAVFCHRHRAAADQIRLGKRMPVVGGWLGAANEYGNGTAVWDAVTGWRPAPEWWAHRRAAKFGEAANREAM